MAPMTVAPNPKSEIRNGSVGLRKHRPPLARLTREKTLAPLPCPIQGKAADRHLVLLQKLVELRPFVKVAHRKAAVDFLLVLILALGREERQEVIERVDRPCVVLAELHGPREQVALNVRQPLADRGHELPALDAG